jgi:hypothetical protein
MHELRMHKMDRAIPNAASRRAHARLSAGLGLAILFALACGLAGRSQSSNGANGGQNSTRPYFTPLHDTSNIDPGSGVDPIATERLLLALNIERQKQMVSDANKLLQLARELNDEVAAAHTESFSADQLQKIAEIEKLAHSVKERMTTGTGQSPGLDPSALAPYSAVH